MLMHEMRRIQEALICLERERERDLLVQQNHSTKLIFSFNFWTAFREKYGHFKFFETRIYDILRLFSHLFLIFAHRYVIEYWPITDSITDSFDNFNHTAVEKVLFLLSQLVFSINYFISLMKHTWIRKKRRKALQFTKFETILSYPEISDRLSLVFIVLNLLLSFSCPKRKLSSLQLKPEQFHRNILLIRWQISL